MTLTAKAAEEAGTLLVDRQGVRPLTYPGRDHEARDMHWAHCRFGNQEWYALGEDAELMESTIESTFAEKQRRVA